jgi:hypothetical protein
MEWKDMVDLWLQYTETSKSPYQFRLWTVISMIAGALERRVWAQSGRYVTYPNMYIALVGSPGVGKQIINEGLEIWREAKRVSSTLPAFTPASDSVTRASLVDEMAAATKTFLRPAGAPLKHHSIMLFSEEFRVIMPKYDTEFVSRLDAFFNGKDSHSESRRTGSVKKLFFENPLLSLLIGMQPAYMAETFPDSLWATGIGRRLIMIYSAESPVMSVFEEPGELKALRATLVSQFGTLSELYGLASWSDEAKELVRSFDMDAQLRLTGQAGGGKEQWPIPKHTRLSSYNRSRTMFLIKLSIIRAVSARKELRITESDTQMALQWLLEAEGLMPDIFREMRGRNDYEIMEECHRFVMLSFTKNKRKPVPEGLIVGFLGQRLPSEKVERVLGVMERSNMIVRVAGTNAWEPKPIFEYHQQD